MKPPPPTDEPTGETQPVDEETAGEEAPLMLMAAAAPQGQAGTTLTAEKTATGNWTRTFKWTIDKSVTPATWDMFKGDRGKSTYTVAVTKDSGTDLVWVSGQVCVTNGGAAATENLTIFDHIQYKAGSGQFQDLPGASQTITPDQIPAYTGPVCYPYSISFTPVAGAVYRNVATITITNHSGSLGEPKGPEPKADFSLPASPTLINNSINVDDTNGGTWAFNASGSVTYDKTFTCNGDAGKHDNTATIRETKQSDDASVQVNCYELTVTKDAKTAFDRTYNWTIDKLADQTSLLLALNQSYLVNYSVKVDETYTDSDWAVAGSITIANPAPMAATLTAVSDVISPAIAAKVDCPSLTVPAGGNLVCTYTADLPDATTRTNTATATLQNTPSGTTNFSGTASVDFKDAVMTEIDECIDVKDTLGGTLGKVCKNDAPKTFTYSYTVGPYNTCGEYKVENTADFVTKDTETKGSGSWTVNVNIPCQTGCTLTIGYWKNHAGFGPQADMVTPLLPKWLGLPLPLGKSIQVDNATLAVQFLQFRGSNNVQDASNGINKLYAQLLAAKLNIAAGADDSAVSSTIFAADTFLWTKNSLDWSKLSKADKTKVLNWMSTLDSFNNGYTGPGHCDQ